MLLGIARIVVGLVGLLRRLRWLRLLLGGGGLPFSIWLMTFVYVLGFTRNENNSIELNLLESALYIELIWFDHVDLP